MVLPVVALIIFERVIVGALVPIEPSTIAGKVPVVEALRMTPVDLVTVAGTVVDATCVAAGFTNPDTVIVMPAPPAIVLAVNVSVSTFDISVGVLSEAPVVAVTEGDTRDGEPVRVMTRLPETGTAVAGVTTMVMETPVPPARTSDNVIAGPVMPPFIIAGKVPVAVVVKL